MGSQHVPSGRAAQPGACCPGALPQAVHTAPGLPLVLEETDTAQGQQSCPFRLPHPQRLRAGQGYPPASYPPPTTSLSPFLLPLPSQCPHPNTTQKIRSREKGQPQGPEGTEGQGDHREVMRLAGVSHHQGCDLWTKTGADRTKNARGWTHRNGMEPESGQQRREREDGAGYESWGAVHT